MIYIAGPGHGGPALVANTYLEGSYSEIYPDVSQDEAGMKRLFKQFSFPRRHFEPCGPDDARLHSRRRRTRIFAQPRLRRRVRQSGTDRRLQRPRCECSAGFAPDAVQRGDFPDDIAGAVPVPGADFVFFAVQIFLSLRVGLAFAELEAVVDLPEAGKRRGQGGTDQKGRTRRILQKVGINVGRVDEEMRPEKYGSGSLVNSVKYEVSSHFVLRQVK